MAHFELSGLVGKTGLTKCTGCRKWAVMKIACSFATLKFCLECWWHMAMESENGLEEMVVSARKLLEEGGPSGQEEDDANGGSP